MSVHNGPVLSVRGLVVDFVSPEGVDRAVNDVTFDLYRGETLGIVGESGSGKSVTCLAIPGLVPKPAGRIMAGKVLLAGEDIVAATPQRLREVRGREISMVFQDPMTSLNPAMRVGDQIVEAIRTHDRVAPENAIRTRATSLLDAVGIPDAASRFNRYPHEYSGGMRQRAMIAMAMANRPSVLIADEPTTALDVTIQAQVLEALRVAQQETEAAMILVTHDLGLIAEVADRVLVMYAGRIVESGDVQSIFDDTKHPYTLALMKGRLSVERDSHRLEPIPGQPPSLRNLPSGCSFHPRCSLRQGRLVCTETKPLLALAGTEHYSACHFHMELGEGGGQP